MNDEFHIKRNFKPTKIMFSIQKVSSSILLLYKSLYYIFLTQTNKTKPLWFCTIYILY